MRKKNLKCCANCMFFSVQEKNYCLRYNRPTCPGLFCNMYKYDKMTREERKNLVRPYWS